MIMFQFYRRIRGTIIGWWRKTNHLKTNLKYEAWIDKVALIPEALFYAVDDFVSKEGEDVFSHTDFEWDEEYQEVKNKIIKILHWYHIGRVELKNEIRRLLNELYGCKTWSFGRERTPEEKKKQIKLKYLERKLEKEETKHLKMIIDIRNYLWT